MKYITLIYGLIFLVMSLIFLWRTRKAVNSSLKNIFWAYTAFSIMKGMSVLSGLSVELLHSDAQSASNNMSLMDVINILSVISSGISNIFLFHFGISLLTYKTSIRIDYKVFPFLLFLAYMALYLSGIVEPYNAEKISRYSFGFNGALLGSIGFFNLYYMKKASGENRLSPGFITCGIALLVYSFTEGIIPNLHLGIPIEILRILSAIFLFITSLFVIVLLKEEKGNRIGFI